MSKEDAAPNAAGQDAACQDQDQAKDAYLASVEEGRAHAVLGNLMENLVEQSVAGEGWRWHWATPDTIRPLSMIEVHLLTAAFSALDRP